jgi:penicillin amidase
MADISKAKFELLEQGYMKSLVLIFLLPTHLLAQAFSNEEVNHWQQQAKQVTIIRDNWGVPHVYGNTDADAVFGLMYSQCEDNYWQLEETYISALGRESELYGEKGLDNDWSAALFRARIEGKRFYSDADPFIKELCNAAAAGINYYLQVHPNVQRRLLPRYEPWYFLIPGGSNPANHGITRQEMEKVMKSNTTYKFEGMDDQWLQHIESGSNMIAIAPTKSATGKSMLLINPHVDFFGNGQRYECHLNSEQGLNVSGFAMFGNFYIWSGFNPNIGWSHTNSGVDFTDVYLERFNHPTDSLQYSYGNHYKQAQLFTDTILCKSDSILKTQVIRFMVTDHGPVVAKRDSFYVTVKNSTGSPPVYVLQCWRMMKANTLEEFQAALNLRAFGYPNTMYTDRFGNIAYWHGNAVPKRSIKFDWRYPVDGSNPETEWDGLHPLNEIIQSINPTSRWLQNCNSTPFLCAGSASPDSSRYPHYMAYDPQLFRAEEALKLLSNPDKISFEQFENLVVSTHLPMMEQWLPQILRAYDSGVMSDERESEKLRAVMDTLRHWDCQTALNSRATTLAVSWNTVGLTWARTQIRPTDPSSLTRYYVGKTLPYSDSLALAFMSAAIDILEKKYGTAFVEWGSINRLQRIHTRGVVEDFDDSKQSLPVKGAPSVMGSLFAFATSQTNTNKRYGTGGNSYVAIIEFGRKVKAKSVMYFGQSADPTSPHYFDQAPLYAQGKFKDVYFYKKDVLDHAERTYHPGE